MSNKKELKIKVTISKAFENRLRQDAEYFNLTFSKLCNKIFYNSDLSFKEDHDKEKESHNNDFTFSLNQKEKEKFNIYKRYIESLMKFNDKNNKNNKKLKKSSFFRNIFIDYLKKTQTEREKFIFKENYDRIKKAIADNELVSIEYFNKKKYIEPYFITTVEGHPFNLVYSYRYLENNKDENKSKYVTFHLSHISSIKTVKFLKDIEKYKNKEYKKIKSKLKSKKINFELYETESPHDTIIIELTEYGKKLFKRIYYNKPMNYKIYSTYKTEKKSQTQRKGLILEKDKKEVNRILNELDKLKKDDNYIYIIRTSQDRIKKYFSQFLYNFKVLYPLELKEYFKSEFKKAYERYDDI